MTEHRVSKDSLLPGETAGDFFRRVAREKPGGTDPARVCGDCGQDHRGPEEYWPEDERAQHRRWTARGDEPAKKIEVIEWPQRGCARRFPMGGWWVVETSKHGYMPLAGPFATKAAAEAQCIVE